MAAATFLKLQREFCSAGPARGRPWLVAVALAGLLPVAQAGLFDDEEARKAIVELRARVTQLDEAAKARLAETAAAATAATNAQAQRSEQLMEQMVALRRSLLELNNQIEALRADVAKLRGTDEQMSRELSEVQKRQRDLGQGLEDRLKRLEPIKVSIDGREHLVDPEERRAHDEALASIRGGDFDKAVAQLNSFQRRYPGSPYVDSARFWTGNAMYGKRDYREAINAFRNFVTQSPEHPRAPEAMLALANSQSELKDTRAARKSLEDLIKAYPQSEAAQAARERLPAIR